MARKKTDIDNAEQVVESNVQEVDSNVQGVGDNSSVETSAYSNEENLREPRRKFLLPWINF